MQSISHMAGRLKITGTKNIADALGCYHRLEKSPHYHELRETVQYEIMAAWLAILAYWGTAPTQAVAKVKTPSGKRIDIANLTRLRFIEETEEAWPQLMEPCGQAALIVDGTGGGFAEERRVLAPAADIAAVNRLMEDWNQAAAQLGVRRCASLTEMRRKVARDRLADPFWRDHYREGLVRISKSEFLRGYRQSGSGKTFVANFDWFLRENSLMLLLEGRYDD